MVCHQLDQYNILQLKPNLMQHLDTKKFLIFWWHIWMWLQLMHLSGLCIQGSTRRNSWVFLPIMWFITKWNNWSLFYVEWRYSAMNTTMFLHISPIIISSGRILLCFSIMAVLLTFVIIIRLIIRCIVLSIITICWAWRFTRIPIALWFPFNKYLWLMLYKN